MDLTGIQWNDWAFVGFSFGRDTALITSNNPPSLSCELTAGASNHVAFRIDPAPFVMLFLPRHSENSLVEGIYISKNGSGPAFLTCTYSELDSMTVRYSGSSYTLPSGTSFTLWGIQ